MIRDWAWNDGDFVLSASGDVALAEDTRVIAQDLLGRLVSPRGSHWAHPDDGLDSQKYIQQTADDLTLLELRQDIELECARDARVRRSSAEVETFDLYTGTVRVLAELNDRALALAAPLPKNMPVQEREYGNIFVASSRHGVVELAANRLGSFKETDEYIDLIDMNPAHFLGTKTVMLTINGVDYPVEVVEINV